MRIDALNIALTMRMEIYDKKKRKQYNTKHNTNLSSSFIKVTKQTKRMKKT